MDRAVRWRDQEEVAPWRQHTHHFLERQPEKFAVLERLAGNHHVRRLVGQGKAIWILEHDVHARPFLQVETGILAVEALENRAIGAVDIAGTDVDDLATTGLEKRLPEITIDTLLEILAGACVHGFDDRWDCRRTRSRTSSVFGGRRR